jgi:hypothetical protein
MIVIELDINFLLYLKYQTIYSVISLDISVESESWENWYSSFF